MRALLALVAAPLVATALPAFAADDVGSNPDFAFRSGTISPVTDFRFGPRDGERMRHHRRGDAVYLYDRDYQGDSAWKSDSFNDWWHDRPERAYPHWMVGNQNCDRQWYQGSVLRC